jgi:23S rRNA (guanosine2251-2'-O)-methyltransferase
VTTSVVGGRRAVVEAVRAGTAQEVLVARDARSTAGIQEVLEACREAGLHVREVDRSELDGLAAEHRGVVAITGAPKAIGERELASWPFAPDDLVVVLDGITDPQNLGAAARSAEAAGATMLVTRTRRAADVTPAAIRASAGALLHLTHARIANIARGLERLKDAGFTVVGLDERAERTVFDLRSAASPWCSVRRARGSGGSPGRRATCSYASRCADASARSTRRPRSPPRCTRSSCPAG